MGITCNNLCHAYRMMGGSDQSKQARQRREELLSTIMLVVDQNRQTQLEERTDRDSDDENSNNGFDGHEFSSLSSDTAAMTQRRSTDPTTLPSSLDDRSLEGFLRNASLQEQVCADAA